MPPVSVLPIGTGNDLARILKWGAGYKGEAVQPILQSVVRAVPVPFDRWEVVTRNGVDPESVPLEMDAAGEQNAGEQNAGEKNAGEQNAGEHAAVAAEEEEEEDDEADNPNVIDATFFFSFFFNSTYKFLPFQLNFNAM